MQQKRNNALTNGEYSYLLYSELASPHSGEATEKKVLSNLRATSTAINCWN